MNTERKLNVMQAAAILSAIMLPIYAAIGYVVFA